MPPRTRKAADPKPDPKADETTNAPADDGPRVTVTPAPDHAKAEQTQRRKAEREHAALLRTQHVEGLQNELGFLERQPKPNAKRIAAVREQLDAFADEPASSDIETA
jgi:hypothetical protein